VEGKFGNAKRKYGLDGIMAKEKETSESTIGIILLIMNLEKLRARFLFVFFLGYNKVREKATKIGFFGSLATNNIKMVA
jgi:hypothetical protein